MSSAKRRENKPLRRAGRLALPLTQDRTDDVRSRETAMKTLTTALILASLIVAPAFIQSARAANDRRDAGQSAQSNGTYAGYPLSEWYRADRW
jgi:hypothetical protein